LIQWAESYEQRVYAELDSFGGPGPSEIPSHIRLEGVLWLEHVKFSFEGHAVAPKRMLMVDDLHRLRRKQRALLIDELTVMRAGIPIWLSERYNVLGAELLSQGARQGRDLHEVDLDEMWNAKQFAAFGQNILDRRMSYQDTVPSTSFSHCLRGELNGLQYRDEIADGIRRFEAQVRRHQDSVRYREWIARAEERSSEPTLDSLADLYVTRILLVRDETKKQMSLDLALPAEELDERDSSSVRGAADLFMHDELNIPYYFGIDRLCVMATNNVEELLFLAAALYDGLQAKQILRKPENVLAPSEQERLLKDAARRKRDFIPKSHTDGQRAQRMLDSIAIFCREKTYLPNAPYAPGVTGVRLSRSEMAKLVPPSKAMGEPGSHLVRVLAECTAENLMVTRESAASTSRDSGTVFYLNRTLCAHYDLPLQMGGWQDVSAADMIRWMERRMTPTRQG